MDLGGFEVGVEGWAVGGVEHGEPGVLLAGFDCVS